ncbi:MAG TPA: hypothetical protein VGW98_12495 [Solirubrobacteraceae bacterium]|nr:hypothetical protein [Solirubrobacteraceae bacterium]
MNVAAYVGHMALVTVTAPGQDRLPWDGYRCYDYALKPWNESAPVRWRKLHQAALKRARREAKRLGVEWFVLAQVWQEQKRGALHRHLLVPMASLDEHRVSAVYVAALHELSGEHDFGYVDRKLELRSPEKAAGYLARYIASELAMCRNLPGHVVEVSRRLTARTGCTMRTLRRARVEWARRARARLDSESPEATARPSYAQGTLAEVKRVGTGVTTRQRSRRRTRRSDDADGSGLAITQAQLRKVWAPILKGERA